MTTETSGDASAPELPTDGAPPHRYTAALAAEIERRWQQYWDDHSTFDTPNPVGPLADPEAQNADGDKLFIHDMFPYPSGDGLHLGHVLGYTGTDVYARYQRMAGRNVLYPMGFDAFGLPAEQFAVETGQHPAITTAQNIARFQEQQRRLGFSYDRRRSLADHRPGVLPLDAVDLRPHLRLVVRPRRRPSRRWHRSRPSRERADRRVRGRHPRDSRWPSLVRAVR